MVAMKIAICVGGLRMSIIIRVTNEDSCIVSGRSVVRSNCLLIGEGPARSTRTQRRLKRETKRKSNSYVCTESRSAVSTANFGPWLHKHH